MADSFSQPEENPFRAPEAIRENANNSNSSSGYAIYWINGCFLTVNVLLLIGTSRWLNRTIEEFGVQLSTVSSLPLLMAARFWTSLGCMLLATIVCLLLAFQLRKSKRVISSWFTVLVFWTWAVFTTVLIFGIVQATLAMISGVVDAA